VAICLEEKDRVLEELGRQMQVGADSQSVCATDSQSRVQIHCVTDCGGDAAVVGKMSL
jgi:hypothetical protein